MTLLKPDVRKSCKTALLQAGADEDIAEFYAEAAQFESDVTHAICRIRNELQFANENQTDSSLMCKALQLMSQNFAAWKKTFESLSVRLDSMSPLQVDGSLLAEGTELQSKCSVLTRKVQINEGEFFSIVDSTHQNQLKVLTKNGKEGYVPTVSCLLPSPDANPRVVIDRVGIFLLMCWYECDKKAKLFVIRSLFKSSSRMCNQWNNRNVKQTRSDERVARRLKRVMTTTGNCEGPLDCSRLHQTLSSIEAELRSRKNQCMKKNDIQNCSQMIETIEELDKALLFYEAFRRHGRSFQRSLRDSASGHRPMQLIFNWDSSIFKDSNKTYKYFEVRLTTEELTVREEETVAVQTEVLPPQQVGELQNEVLRSQEERSNQTDITSSDQQEICCSSVVTSSQHSSTVNTTDVNKRLEHRRLHSSQCLPTDEVKDDEMIIMIDNVSAAAESLLVETQDSSGSSCAVASAEQERILFGGGLTRQSVDAEQVVVTSHEQTQRFVVKTVIDPRDSSRISMQQAENAGIIDQSKGLYINPTTGTSVSIAKAIGDGNIAIEHVATTRTLETTRSIGLLTIRTEIDTHEYTISAAMDTATGERLDADEASRRGIIDEQTSTFYNTATQARIPVERAIDAGLVFADFENSTSPPQSSSPLSEVQTYAVSAVVDQLRQRAVPFSEAVKLDLVDRNTGSYVNNVTGELVFAGDAIRRGFYKCQKVDDSSLASMASSDRMIVDKIDRVRKNVLRKVRVAAAFKNHTQPSR